MIAGLLGSAAPPLAAAPQPALRAGAAMVDITPDPATLGPTDLVRDPLYARAIVIDSGPACAVLVGVDAGGLPEALVREVIIRASVMTGCAKENFVVSATHTHSASTGLPRSRSGGAPEIQGAILSAIEHAKARLRPARIGFGQTEVHLNVNRDLMANARWTQGPNPAGPSDKTLAVIALIGEDGQPIGAYLNYAMHPINFYMSGVISADFAGEASRYVERRYGSSMVAIFAQGASGDQNPRLTRPQNRLSRIRTGVSGAATLRVGAVTADDPASMGRRMAALGQPVPAEALPAYRAAVDEVGEIVSAAGALLGESAVDLIQDRQFTLSSAGSIRGARTTVTCPGRDRLDAANPVREGALPPYQEGVPVTLGVGMLRIADIYLATVNAEVYSAIGSRLKAQAPAAKLMMTTLANGAANSGYVYSEAAKDNLTFQVIGSRLKPGCAEAGILEAALSLIAGVGGDFPLSR